MLAAMDEQAFRERIRQRLDALKLSARAASLQAGGSVDLLRMILNGRTSFPRADSLEKIAKVLQTTPDWLLYGDPKPGDAASPPPSLGRNEVTPANVDLPAPNDMPRDVPVFGTAAGSVTGAVVIEEGIADFVRRPPGLKNARHAYALFVSGESMVPILQPGDLIFVDPDQRANVGDIVVVQISRTDHDPPDVFVKKLRRRGPRWLVLEQTNPLATIEQNNTTVVAVHRVLSMRELFGI